MRWAGHFTWMLDVRLPKQLFYIKLQSGKRSKNKFYKGFKDIFKNDVRIQM